MKYFFLWFLLLVCSFYVFAQKQNVETANGYNIFYYPNGQISSEGNMKNGKPDGYWKSYYVDGRLKAEGLRKNALLDSVWVFYNVSGKIKEKINYLDGKKNGYYYSFKYFTNKSDSLIGYLASQELFLDNQRHGVSETFYSNGTLKSSINYIKGKKEGISREYNRDGILIIIIKYQHGIEIEREIINQYRDSLKNGLWKEYYPNGKIKSERNYLMGELNGLVKEYDLSGELLYAHRYDQGVLMDTTVNIENAINVVENFYDKRDQEGNYIKKSSGGFVDGIPIGVHRTYDSLGRVNSSRLYDSEGNLIAQGIVNEEGDRLGDWTYYYPTGKIKSKGRYRSNKRFGPWVYFYPNGNIEQRGSFKRGVPDDLWQWYFESGMLKREEYYRLGLEEGESTEYDEEGIVIGRGDYVEGLKEGKWFFNFYFHTEEGNYSRGFKEGIWHYYYSNGALYFQGKFLQGFEDGKHMYYYKNGKIKEVRYYIFGRKYKSWEYYDYYGSLLKILTFEDDKLIKIDGVTVEID